MKQPVGPYSRDRTRAVSVYPSPLTFNQGPADLPLAGTGHESNSLMGYLRTLSRWWMVIAGAALAGGLLSVLFTVFTLPVFEARTSLDIQSINSDFLNMRNVAATGDSLSSSSEYYVQTQIKLLQSATVLDRTVQRLQAEAHPEAIDRNDLVSRMKRAIHLSRGHDLPYAELLNDAARRVKVKPLGITRLVEVTCDSWDAEFSAKFCNTLTDEYRSIDLETRGTEAQRTSEFLTRQVADVRQKAEESQRLLEAATGGDGLALSQQSNNIGEDRLRQMQGELVRAQAQRIERESALTTALAAAPESIPAALDSVVYRDYQHKLSDLNAQVAELVPPLTEQHPKVIHLRSQIAEVEAGMGRERQATLARLRNEFESARQHQRMLAAAYASLQTSVSGEMSRTERVNLIRREVDSEQQLYQTLLQRAREAGFASAMQMTSIRMVDAATVPKIPISPRRGTALVAGLLLGSLSGLSFALFKDRTSNVLQAPGEAETYLQVRELGVIPANPSLRRDARTALRLKPEGDAELTSLKLAGLPPTLHCWTEQFSIVAEAYRYVSHSLLLSATSGKRARVYVVTSPNAGEGKTTVTTNIGVALSKSKMRAVIVDGDLRKPGLHKKLLVENSLGVRDLLREEIDVATAPLEMFCRQTVVPNLSLVTAGSGNEDVVELLHSKAVTALLNRLVSEFDLVLIDMPPMLHMADARILAGHADGVLLVFRAGMTSRDDAADACNLFEKDEVPLVGTILNDFDPRQAGRRRYYQSYYRYKDEITAEQETGARL